MKSIIAILAFLFLHSSLRAEVNITSLCADRTAIERIYYAHRLGQKPAFEQVSPPSLIAQLVKDDLCKEATLKRVYDVEVPDALVAGEVQRINSTTHAPEVLAEIKAALGNNPERFAISFAKPFLVERLLHVRFDNDDAMHSGSRRQVESARAELLAAKTNHASSGMLQEVLKRGRVDNVNEATWQLGARPAETNAPGSDIAEVQKRFGPNAQILSSPQAGDSAEQKFYFVDLPDELQKVLEVQLRQAGDFSAVIETPNMFLLYLAKERTANTLSVATLSVPKRNFEQWLNEQSKTNL